MTDFRPQAHQVDGRVLLDVRALITGAMIASAPVYPDLIGHRGAYLLLLMAAPTFTRPRLGLASAGWVLFLIVTWIGYEGSANHTVSHDVYSGQLFFTMIFVAVRVIVADRRAMMVALYGYLIGGVYTTYYVLKHNQGSQLSLAFNDLNQRYTSGQINPNNVAYALAAGIGLAVIVAYTDRRRGLFPAVLAAIGAYAGVVLTGTRGAAVAFGVTAVWALVSLFGSRRLIRGAFAVVCALAGALALGILTGLSDNLMLSIASPEKGRETGTLNGRLTLWPAARDLFDHHLLFGAGPGMFSTSNPSGAYAHNALLDIGTSLGLVGLIVWCAVIWITFWHSTREADRTLRLVAVGAALCSLTPPLLTGYWFQTPSTAIVFALFSHVAVLNRRRAAEPGLEVGGDANPASTRRPAGTGGLPVDRRTPATA